MLVSCTNCTKEFEKKDSQIKKTKNNFCTRSCAATFNNLQAPKRKPEGSCKSCGEVISTARKFCLACSPTVTPEQVTPSEFQLRNPRTWSDSDLAQAVADNTSMKAVCLALGLKTDGGVQRWLKGHIVKLALCTKHFVRTKVNSAKVLPLTELCKEKPLTTSSSNFRKRLIREGWLVNACSECDMEPLWNNKQLTLQLDHIDGNKNNNRIENLRLLCPNCHSQTETFCGRNCRFRIPKACSDCGVPIQYESARCPDCHIVYVAKNAKCIKVVAPNGRVRYFPKPENT